MINIKIHVNTTNSFISNTTTAENITTQVFELSEGVPLRATAVNVTDLSLTVLECYFDELGV